MTLCGHVDDSHAKQMVCVARSGQSMELATVMGHRVRFVTAKGAVHEPPEGLTALMTPVPSAAIATVIVWSDRPNKVTDDAVAADPSPVR